MSLLSISKLSFKKSISKLMYSQKYFLDTQTLNLSIVWKEIKRLMR